MAKAKRKASKIKKADSQGKQRAKKPKTTPREPVTAERGSNPYRAGGAY